MGGYVTIEEKIEVIKTNSKMKDRLFDKVYESDESKRHLAEFLIGKASEEVCTENIRPVIFGNKYNDLAFLYDRCIYIMMEEQSTECVNIAYRLLEYVVAGLRQQIPSEKVLYGTARVMFPVPKLFTVKVGLIEGNRTIPDIETTIRLSDSYITLTEELINIKPDLEVSVKIYDFRMKIEEVLRYIEEDILPERWAVYKLHENELLQYAVSASCLTYVQRAINRKESQQDQLKYRMPEKITDIADLIKVLIDRSVLKTLFLRKEVCDLTVAQFSREDIIRESSREEGRIEGIIEGKVEEIFSSVFCEDYSMDRGAEKLNLTKDEFSEKYKLWLKRK